MAALGFELIYRFLWGSLFVLFFVSRLETSEKFLGTAVKIAWGTTGVLVLLAVGTLKPGEWWTQLIPTAIMTTITFALYHQRHERRVRTSVFVCFVLFGLIHAAQSPGLGSDLVVRVKSVINFLSGSLILGSFFGGQFLGHWYLNVPGMHIVELKRVTMLMFVALTAKTLEVIGTLAVAANQTSSLIDDMGRPLGTNIGNSDAFALMASQESLLGIRGELALGLGTFGLLILSARLLWGLVAPWILAFMVKRTVETRSTQSATGILYALCVMVIIGEASALFLKSILGWNL